MAPKQRKSRRKVRTETAIELSQERADMLKIAAMLERLAAEIKKLLLSRT